MEKFSAGLLVVSFLLIVIVYCQAGLQARYQLRLPQQINAQSRNFIQNRLIPQRVAPPMRYPPLPQRQILGDNRNFIPNRFDIPASIIDRKPAANAGCTGPPPCGIQVAPPLPPPVAYTGLPQTAYAPQLPPMTPQAYAPNGVDFLTQQTAAAMTAKAKLLGMVPGRKFVPHLPPMGRHQPGKPPYNPPPKPLVPPQVPGFGLAGSMQPLAYGQPGMVPPQAPAFGQPPQMQPVAGIGGAQAVTAPLPLPQPQTPYAPPQPQQGFNQIPSPLAAQQHDEPQPMNAVPPPSVPYPAGLGQTLPYGDPSQQMPQGGSYDIAKKRTLVWKSKAQAKRFGIPRPVVRSRLVPKPLWKRHS